MVGSGGAEDPRGCRARGAEGWKSRARSLWVFNAVVAGVDLPDRGGGEDGEWKGGWRVVDGRMDVNTINP